MSLHRLWRRNHARQILLLVSLSTGFSGVQALAQELAPQLLGAMHWRLIGPFRAGRVTSVAGVPSQPSVYYMGTPGGGVWKTDDAGEVWKPIFDQQHIASIGAVAVSPSAPNIVYVGTGEQTAGDGIYKSTDAGATWINIGLRQTHIVTGILIDPQNPDIVLVAAAGNQNSHDERGVYKTTDGGKNWQKVLFKDRETAAVDLEVDPDNPRNIYASMLRRPEDPFNPDDSARTQQDTAIYKSADQGSTWAAVEGKGLPSEPMGRAGVAVAPGSKSMRLYAIVTQGLFRSDDGGANWQRSTSDPRILGNSYFSRVFIDPKNPDVIYLAQTSMYRSVDGGRNFIAWVGAPSGDDFHVLWINPSDTKNMILGVDQGAIVSVDHGNSWSSWYNQPTGQFYHVSTDQRFPYYVYGAQQDSGTAAVASRSDYGEITYRDWAPTGGFEFAYIVPDPLNPNYVYTGGWYGTVLRYDRTTGQIVHLFARTSKYRTAQMAPFAFSPQDPHSLYVGAQYVLKSNDGGFHWKEISPDLTQKSQKIETAKEQPSSNPAEKKAELLKQRLALRRAVITTLAPSPVKSGEIWVSTGDGIIQITRDGKTWHNVTIPGLPERSAVNSLEASRHDAATAYAVINVRKGTSPLIYRTHDYGEHWQSVTVGLSESASALVVREDPVRKGLLFAGAQNAVYFSLDDGDHWQTLQLNLPTTPITDLDVHGDDLVASTFGRALWILDNITPLRQLDSNLLQSQATMLRPANAVRTRWDMNQDTPLPSETPAGKNPPDGAVIDYFLKTVPSADIKLSIYDAQNNLVREYSSIVPASDRTPPNVPDYWFAPPVALSKNAGLNRFVWDLRYPPPKTMRYGYFNDRLDFIEYTLADHAIPGEFPREQPQGPFVVPGTYSLVLNVEGKTYKQPLTVSLDSRVHVSQSDLVQQLETERNISSQLAITYAGYDQLAALRKAIADRQKSLGDAGGKDAGGKEATDALKSLDEQAESVADGTQAEWGLGPLNRELSRLAIMVESGDAKPAAALQEGVNLSCQQLGKRLSQWRDVNEKQIPSTNVVLQKHNLAPLAVNPNIPATPHCGV